MTRSVAMRDVALELRYQAAQGRLRARDVVRLTVPEFQLVFVYFMSDHGLLRDNNINYEPTGTVFAEPEWLEGTNSRNYPISHTMNDEVRLTLGIKGFPGDLPVMTYDMTGQGPAGFNFEGPHALRGGANVIDLSSTDRIERKIQRIKQGIVWRAAKDGHTWLSKETGPHTVYVTMGEPQDWMLPQHAVTVKRMERAIRQAAAADSLNPHEIVRHVIQAQRFDLHGGQTNAWVVPDEPSDCQSIVRFAQKVNKMLNIPGVFDHVNIYAIETAPTVAIENDPEAPVWCCGFNSDPRRHPNEDWYLTLVDSGGGCNAFESAAKFTACGETRYYPGGTTLIYDNKDDVLYSFAEMRWRLPPNPCIIVGNPVHVYQPMPPTPPVPTCP